MSGREVPSSCRRCQVNPSRATGGQRKGPWNPEHAQGPGPRARSTPGLWPRRTGSWTPQAHGVCEQNAQDVHHVHLSLDAPIHPVGWQKATKRRPLLAMLASQPFRGVGSHQSGSLIHQTVGG